MYWSQVRVLAGPPKRSILLETLQILKKNTLLVVDDSPIVGYFQQTGLKNNFNLINPGLVPAPTISGKGGLVHQHAIRAGAKMLFSNYQTGWIGFN